MSRFDNRWWRAVQEAEEEQERQAAELEERIAQAPHRLRTDAHFHHHVYKTLAALGVSQGDEVADLIIKVLVAEEYIREISPDPARMPLVVQVPGEFLEAVARANQDNRHANGILFVPSEAVFP